MTPAPSFQELIETVRRDAASDDALDQLSTAVQTAHQLNETGDSVLGHYVDQARRAGHSWTEISTAIGVSKQAVHKRFGSAIGGAIGQTVKSLFGSAGAGRMSRFTARTRNCVTAASSGAIELDHRYVGTEHLLLGLHAEPEAIATRILTANGITRQVVVEEILQLVGRGSEPVTEDPPLTPRATKVFEDALAVALEHGHNYIGTEHFLLALFRSDGVAKKVMEKHGLTEEKARTAVGEALSGLG